MRLTAKQVPESIGLQGDLSISGKVIRVFDKKSGTSDKGDWSFQGFVVQDETGEMNVVLKNRPEEFKKEDVGKSIAITSTKTSKGIFGVKVEEESYTDSQQKPHKAIKVIITPSASVKWEYATEKKPESEHIEEREVVKAEPVDLDKIRKDTIKISIDAYFEALKNQLTDVTKPEIICAVIQAAGRNADTMFIAQNRG